jgi:hypothetical protein
VRAEHDLRSIEADALYIDLDFVGTWRRSIQILDFQYACITIFVEANDACHDFPSTFCDLRNMLFRTCQFHVTPPCLDTSNRVALLPSGKNPRLGSDLREASRAPRFFELLILLEEELSRDARLRPH